MGLRLLWHDVSDTTSPELPTLSELGMQEMLRSAGGVYTGVFAADLAVLTMWLPDAPPWVSWRNIKGGNEIVHPDDRYVLADALATFCSGDTAPRCVAARLRSESGWRAAELSISPYPGPLSDRLVLVQISTIADEFDAATEDVQGSDRGGARRVGWSRTIGRDLIVCLPRPRPWGGFPGGLVHSASDVAQPVSAASACLREAGCYLRGGGAQTWLSVFVVRRHTVCRACQTGVPGGRVRARS